MSDGSVTIDTKLNSSEFEKGLKNLKKTIENTLPSASSALNVFSKGFKKLGSIATSAGKVCSIATTAITGVFTASALKAKSFIGTYESAMAVFNKKLEGGVEAAKELYNSLLTIAKGSSFAQENLISAGQTLVAMGVDANKTTKYVQIATDAIAGMGGKGSDIEELTEVFGKMSMQTNVYTDDLNQLAMKGIPVFDILATKYGVTKDKVKEMASKGLLPASETLETFTEALNCTDEASQYFQYSIAGMAKSLKSGTLTGALDSLNSSFRTFALKLLDLDPRTESGKKNINGLIQVCQTFGAILEDVGNKFSFIGEWLSDFISKLATVTETTDESGNKIKIYGGYLGELKRKLDGLSPETLEKIAKTILSLATAGPILLAIGKGFNVISSAFGALSSVSKAMGVFKGATTSSIASVNMLAKVFTILTGPVGIVIGVIVAVIAVLVLLYKKSENFRNAVNKAFEQIKISLLNAWEKIKPSLKKLGEAFGVLLEKLEPVGEFLIEVLSVAFTVVADVLSKIISVLAEVITWLVEVVTFIIKFFTEIIPNAWNSLISGLQNLATTIWYTLVNAWNSIISFFTEGIPNFINTVIQWFQELPYKIGLLIGEILGNIIQFGIDIGNWVVTELPKIIQGIIDWFAELPSRIWKWLQDTINNIIAWGQKTYNTAITWISNTINGIIEWFKSLPRRIQEWLQNTINSVTNWGKNMAEKGKESAQSLFDNIINTLKELPSKMIEIGKNIVEGLWNGITGAGNWIKENVENFASGLLDGMKNALGIHSPSVVFRDEVGKYIALGVGEGVTRNIDEVYNKIQSAVEFETSKLATNLSTKATLEIAKDQPRTINNEHGVTINNTQQFYSKNATPYEEQKQAKQQLRRLAYGL